MYDNVGIVVLAIFLGLIYIAIGVVLMCCTEKDRPVSDVEIPETAKVLFWPLFMVFMLVVCIIGTLSKWYYWVQK